MKKGADISAKFKDLYLVHQNVPGKAAKSIQYDEHILFIPLQGEIGVTTNGSDIRLGMGHMLYLPPKTLHSFSSSESLGERLIVMLQSKVIRHSNPTRLPLNQLIKEVLFYLLLHPKTKAAKSLTDVFIETLEESLSETTSKISSGIEHLEGRVSDQRVLNALGYLRDNFAEVDLKAAAKVAGLSERNLSRLMLRETGLSPKQWLINYRVEKARELLKKPGASVTDVAYTVGYNSLGQFISAFRSRTGQLPSEYIKHG